MNDKIVIKGKFAFKTTKRPPIQKKKGETVEKIQRKRSAEFGGANNASVVISLEFTVELC